MIEINAPYGDFAGLIEVDTSDTSMSGNHLRNLLIQSQKISLDEAIVGFEISFTRHSMDDGIDEKFIELKFITDSDNSGHLNIEMSDFFLLVESLNFAVTKNFTLSNPNVRFRRAQKN